MGGGVGDCEYSIQVGSHWLRSSCSLLLCPLTIARSALRLCCCRPSQTIQYILPSEPAKLAQAELLVIDEAAAIPLPTVRSHALLAPRKH